MGPKSQTNRTIQAKIDTPRAAHRDATSGAPSDAQAAVLPDRADTAPAPRIGPLVPPYEPLAARALKAMMPARTSHPPLNLFRTLARNLALTNAMQTLGGYMLGRHPSTTSSIAVRDREVVIARICARCSCEYEWGVHVRYYGPQVAFSEEHISALAHGGPDAPCWSRSEALLIRLVDELYDTAQVSDPLWTELATTWPSEQLLEFLVLVGWYQTISYVANGARVAREPWAPRLPQRPEAASAVPASTDNDVGSGGDSDVGRCR